MSNKIDKDSVTEIILNYGLKIPSIMSKDLITATINLVGGDDAFIAMQKEVAGGKSSFTVDDMLSYRETYAFFMVNQEALQDYVEDMAIGANQQSAVHAIFEMNQMHGRQKHSFGKIAKSLYGVPDRIDNVSNSGLFVAGALIAFAVTGLLDSYSTLINTDAYEFMMKRKAEKQY